MQDFRADLHCHSTFSDGSKTPKEIVLQAKRNGLSGLSITDHDTIDAYETAFSIAADHSLDLIPGVEFSAEHRGHSVHILGYSFSTKSLFIQQLCQKHFQRRIRRYKAILELLARESMPISEQELTEQYPSHTNIGRPHIALVMVKKGYVKSLEEAFFRFLAEGKSCYVKGESFSVEETIRVIHEGGGLAIIAHPHLMKRRDILKDLLDMNFDGIEGYYANFGIEENKRWIDIGKKKKWIITGGSDSHGNIKPQITLGCSWVGESTFHILKQHLMRHGKDSLP
ncbi:MAG TPA: PHP domain-containing protein [Waddliaceae bacterium]